MGVTIGLDIGGTKIAGAVVDDRGRVVTRARVHTPAQDPGAIVDAAAELTLRLRAEHEAEAVGVACAAFVDRERATVRFAPNIAWRDTPLKALLQERTGLPVAIENDANAAAWGEFCFGPARDVEHMVLLTIGTGVGGGVVAEGRLLRGAFGIGAELGHIVMVPDGHLCGCGNLGCLEQYASGNALVREARDLVRREPERAPELTRRCGGDPERLQGPDVTEAALAGDAPARGLLADLGRWIGRGAVGIGAVLDPTMFVIAGGVAAAGELLLHPARETFENHLPGRGHRPCARWALAALGDDAGVIGAATLARHEEPR